MHIRLRENNTVRIVGISLFAIMLAIVLIAGLLKHTKINPDSILEDIQIIPAWALFLTLIIMLFNVMIGAQNWRLVVRLVSHNDANLDYSFYLTYTALSAFLGLFIPIQISTMIIRSLSLRLGGYSSFGKSAVTALISQIQDVVIILLFLIPGIFVLFWKASTAFWLACEIALVGGGYVFFNNFSYPVIKRISSLKAGILEKPLNLLQEGISIGLFDNALLIKLYRNSLIKFIIIAFQSYLISQIIGLNTSPVVIISISSLVRMSIIVAITPGNVGITEWGWTGLLGLVGISAHDAGHFAITSTILGYGSTIAASALIIVVFLLAKSSRSVGIPS